MKHLLILFFLISNISTVLAQQICQTPSSFAVLEINNVRARVLGGGGLWWDLSDARYEVPKNSGVSSIFAGGLWLGGIDDGGQLRLAAQTYRQGGTDFFVGPGSDSANCYAYDYHWSVERDSINAHRSKAINFNNNIPINEIPKDILGWPAKGNQYAKGKNGIAISVNDDLAPFVDVDNNGNYDPTKGDYPDVPGDQAIWWVFNDYTFPHTESGGEKLFVDVHAMAYAYANPGALQHTTFYRYKIINKGGYKINDMYVGQWTDVDLGYAFDDHVGCDTVRNMGIGYNADGNDGPANVSYNQDPPMIGVKFLRTPQENGIQKGLTSFVYYYNDFSVIGNPEMPEHYYYYLTDKWKNGTLRTFGGNGFNTGSPTTIMFPDKPGSGGWSECDAGAFAGDRRMLMSTGPYTLVPGGSMELDFAVVWAKCPGQVGCMADFDCLGLSADIVQAYFDNAIVLNNSHIEKGMSEINIYPNPTKGKVKIDCSDCTSAKEIRIEVSDISGKKVSAETFNGNSTFTVTQGILPPGIYILTIIKDELIISNRKVVFK